jgi:hypothetical protein
MDQHSRTDLVDQIQDALPVTNIELVVDER